MYSIDKLGLAVVPLVRSSYNAIPFLGSHYCCRRENISTQQQQQVSQFLHEIILFQVGLDLVGYSYTLVEGEHS